MHGVETILFLVVLGTVVAAFAGRLRVPAPSLLVIAGLVVGLLPRFPPVHVGSDRGARPGLLLVGFLPPGAPGGVRHPRHSKAQAGRTART